MLKRKDGLPNSCSGKANVGNRGDISGALDRHLGDFNIRLSGHLLTLIGFYG